MGVQPEVKGAFRTLTISSTPNEDESNAVSQTSQPYTVQKLVILGDFEV